MPWLAKLLFFQDFTSVLILKFAIWHKIGKQRYTRKCYFCYFSNLRSLYVLSVCMVLWTVINKISKFNNNIFKCLRIYNATCDLIDSFTVICHRSQYLGFNFKVFCYDIYAQWYFILNKSKVKLIIIYSFLAFAIGLLYVPLIKGNILDTMLILYFCLSVLYMHKIVQLLMQTFSWF